MRRLALPLAVLATAAGCGGGVDKDEYSRQYRTLNDRLLQISQDVETGLRTANRKSNRQLSEQFAGFGLRLEAVGTDLRRLEAPDELKDESETLAERIDATVEDLKALSGATGEGDRPRTAAAVLDFGVSSQDLDRAQDALARATGARVDPR